MSVHIKAVGLSDSLDSCRQSSVASGCLDGAGDNISFSLIAWYALHSLGDDFRADFSFDVSWKIIEGSRDYGTGLARISLSDFGDHCWDDRVSSGSIIAEGSSKRFDSGTCDVGSQAWEIGDNGQNSLDNCSLIRWIDTLEGSCEFSLDLGRKGLGLDGGDTGE